MKVEVTYGDAEYSKCLEYNIKSAYKRGRFDKVYAYRREDIDADFLKRNKRFFDCKRGGGYWIWKAYFIKKTLELLNEGDYLFYCDAGALFIKPVDKLIKVMTSNDEDMMFFEINESIEKHWTKRDIFIALDCDTEEYSESKQYMGTFWLIKKNGNTVNFVNEYFEYVQQGTLITDDNNELGFSNYDGFRDNRHDQSVLSILAKKHGYEGYKDPSQWGGTQKYKYKYKTFDSNRDYKIYEKSKYPVMILLHRLRGNANIRGILGCYKNYIKECIRLRKSKGKC